MVELLNAQSAVGRTPQRPRREAQTEASEKQSNGECTNQATCHESTTERL